jgi:hypothetical protein
MLTVTGYQSIKKRRMKNNTNYPPSMGKTDVILSLRSVLTPVNQTALRIPSPLWHPINLPSL